MLIAPDFYRRGAKSRSGPSSRGSSADSSARFSTNGCATTSADTFVQLFDVEPGELARAWRPAFASSAKHAAPPWPSSTTATSTPAITSFIRKTSSATSWNQPLAALVESEQQQQFGVDKARSLPRYCRECDVRFACNGECPKHRFTHHARRRTGTELSLRRLQDVLPARRSLHALHGGRARATSALPPTSCAGPRPRREDAERQSADRPGRNDPCPCGSGRKYKKCCGVKF